MITASGNATGLTLEKTLRRRVFSIGLLSMFPRTRFLLLGAGISGVMAILAPAAHAIDGLILEHDQPAAHDGDAVRAVGFAADGAGGDWVISGGEDAKLADRQFKVRSGQISFY